MKNKKGFTLTELIAVIVVLALLVLIGIPAYSSIRKSVLEKQYQNLVALIETNATKLASSKDTNLTNVQELIDEGLLETDDGEYIYDPRDKSKMNCFLIEIEYEKGNYKSKLLDTQNCNLEEAKKEFGKINIIATGEESKNEIIFSESENNWVKENVTLSVNTANIPESEIVSGYRWVVANGKTSADATIDLSTKTILNTTVNVELTTNSEQKYFANTAVRIDKEAPIITDIEVSGGNDWTKGKNLAITATDQKGSGIAGYYVGKESCTETTTFESTADESYNISISAEELESNEEQFYICVKDKVGNIKSQETKLSMADSTAPTCVWGGESTSWTKNNRTITLSCEDSESGCDSNRSTYSKTFDYTTKTEYIEYTIYDNAGNSTVCQKDVNVYVDKDTPKLEVEIYKWATNDEESRPTASTYSNLSKYELDTWSDKKLFTIAIGEDDGSQSLTYYYTTTGKTTNNTEQKAKSRNIEAQGISTIQYKVCDKAGNCTISDVYTVKIDRSGPTAPTMNFVYSDWSVYPNNTWTKNYVYAGRTKSSPGPTGSVDSGVGLSHYEISKDGVNWVKFNYDYTSDMYKMSTTGTHKRYFRAVDLLGKTSSSTILTAKIDKTKPTVPTVVFKKWSNNSTKPTSSNYTSLSDYDPGTKSDKYIYTRATSTDAHSGDIKYYYTTTGATTDATDYNARTRNIQAIGTSTIKYKACDAVGNCSDYTDAYSVIIEPSVQITGNIANWVCGKCKTACSSGDAYYRAKDGDGNILYTSSGNCGNSMGKVTYTASDNTVTFKWVIRQGGATHIDSGYWVKFIIKNSSGTLYTKVLKSTDVTWGMGSNHSGSFSYTFAKKGTYYIYIDGNSTDPGFDMNFGTIKVS